MSAAEAAPPHTPPDVDIRNAVPVTQAGKLPKSAERYRALQKEMQRAKPGVETAKQKSEALSAQAAALRQQLVATAARVQDLEHEKTFIDGEIARLSSNEKALAARFARDRIHVARLIAVLERLQSDLPPAIALEPADALSSARGTMVLGSALPRLYAAAAALSRQLHTLKETRAALLMRRTESTRNAAKLSLAQRQLDGLLVRKQRQASGADAEYATWEAKFESIVNQASDLKALLDRVAELRQSAASEGMVVVSGGRGGREGRLTAGSLVRPVMGQLLTNSLEPRAPGVNFLAPSSATVVAPADSHVVFAGPYHKTGQVLILEAAGGYDLVLAGLDRIDVRTGDQLLAGEPVGKMSRERNGAKLYFELRQHGRSVNPAPWFGVDLRKAKKS
ncbi:MAG: murein hydrolase activator EnvC family protein [Rhizomicrobium sp.]